MTAILQDPSGIQIDSEEERGISIRVNEGEKINLSDYYQALNGSYIEGVMEFPVRGLREGANTITFEAFDNQGNSSYQTLEIYVSNSEQIRILTHLVYPNPSSSFSQFQLSHNREGENLELKLNIYSLSGSEIFSLSRRFAKADPILDDLSWFFIRSKTKYPAKGTYLYVLELKSEADGSSDNKSGKIIIQ